MAALEYLTNNSLIAYPFKDAVAVAANPIQESWFLDMLLAPKSKSVKRIYMQRIRTDGGLLHITFKDCLAAATLATIEVNHADVVDHLNNKDVAFYAFSNEALSAKLVFGAGLVTLCAGAAFDYTYTKEEAEVSSGAIALYAPVVKSLTFSNVQADNTYAAAHSYASTDTLAPYIARGTNTKFLGEPSAGIGMYVGRGLGLGLYDPCSNRTGIYSINKLAPDDRGHIYLATSSCYSLSLLTYSKKLEYDSSDPSPLRPYYLFPLYNGDTFAGATDISNTILISNNCKPKCPPEAVNATAGYMNRLADGLQDIVDFVKNASETRGLITAIPTTTTFVASSFCATLPADWARSGIKCNGSFSKYFHEGRNLLIRYAAGDVRKHKIVEVVTDTPEQLESTTVILDGIPAATTADGPFYFRVEDFGVGATFAHTISEYNTLSVEANSKPYIEVVANTSEAWSQSGAYTTFMGVSVGLYNPGRTPVAFVVAYTPASGTSFTPGSVKLRFADANSTRPQVQYNVASGILGCRDYAFSEIVLEAQATGEPLGASLEVQLGTETFTRVLAVPTAPKPGSVYLNDQPVDPDGEPPALIFRDGVYARHRFDGKDASGQAFDLGLIEIHAGNAMPSFITKTADVNPVSLTLSGRYTAVSGASTSYMFIDVRSVRFEETRYVSSRPKRYKLVFMAAPVITNPVDGQEITVFGGREYTDENPLLTISVSDPQAQVSISLDPSCGLTLSTEGRIKGKLTAPIQDTPVTLTATSMLDDGSPWRSDTVHVLLRYAHATPPTIEAPMTQAALLDITYTEAEPLLRVTGTHVSAYTALNLPPGLLLDSVTGAVTGAVTVKELTSYMCTFIASNDTGTDQHTTAIQTVAGVAPNITYPTVGLYITLAAFQEYPESEPVCAVLSSTFAAAYTAEGLPTGLTIDSYGRITGSTASAGTYSVVVTATNSVGSSSQLFFLNVEAVVPTILSPGEGVYIDFYRGAEYSLAQPLDTCKAADTATTFAIDDSGEQLPTGLKLAPSGEIYGTTIYALQADIVVVASNSAGASAPVSFKLRPKDGGIPVVTSITNATKSGSTYVISELIRNHAYATIGRVSAAFYPTSYGLIGTPPPGITISADGVLSGTWSTVTTAETSFTFIIRAINTRGASDSCVCKLTFEAA